MTRYEIRKGKNAPCELVSIVTRENPCMVGDMVWHDVGFEYTNFVCEGTCTYCNKIKEKLE